MEYKNVFISNPDENGDGIVITGPYEEPILIENIHIDFSGYEQKHDELDENISFVNHANAIVRNSIFSNGIKLALVGNGDFPTEDRNTKVVFENCIFENFGRRAIEAQDGISVQMKNCVIKNWGQKEWFDVRSFATWSHTGASIELDHCYFIQDSFFQSGVFNSIIDILNHIGNSFNEFSLSWKSFIPGVMRGAMSTTKGKIKCTSCFKNKKWIFLENSENEITDRDNAFSDIEKIYKNCKYEISEDLLGLLKK